MDNTKKTKMTTTEFKGKFQEIKRRLRYELKKFDKTVKPLMDEAHALYDAGNDNMYVVDPKTHVLKAKSKKVSKMMDVLYDWCDLDYYIMRLGENLSI